MGKCNKIRVISWNNSIEMAIVVLQTIASPADLLAFLLTHNIRNIPYINKVILHPKAAKQGLALC
jgi:hypothetical protein